MDWNKQQYKAAEKFKKAAREWYKQTGIHVGHVIFTPEHHNVNGEIIDDYTVDINLGAIRK